MPLKPEGEDVQYTERGSVAEEQEKGREAIVEVERIIRDELDGLAIEAVVFEVVVGDGTLRGFVFGSVAGLMGITGKLGEIIWSLIEENQRRADGD